MSWPRIRLPRIRYTIGRLMIVVFLASLISWSVFVVRPRIIDQHIVAQQAEASYKQAKLVREVAEFALKEYVEGIYKQDKATYEGQIALAKSDQQRAIDRLKWSTEMRKKGKLSITSNIADELTKQQADFDLEQAQTQLVVLEKYTKEKQIKMLKSDVERAKADELAKLGSYQRERYRRWWTLLGF
jgi:HlyD family secretion protein